MRPHFRLGKTDALFCFRTTAETTRLFVEACSPQTKKLTIVTSEVTRSRLLSSSYLPPLAMKNQIAWGLTSRHRSAKDKGCSPSTFFFRLFLSYSCHEQIFARKCRRCRIRLERQRLDWQARQRNRRGKAPILIIVDSNYHDAVGAERETPIGTLEGDTKKLSRLCFFFFLALQLIRIIELSFR